MADTTHASIIDQADRRPLARDTMTLEELAGRLGISMTVAYERAHADDLPVPVIRVGRRFLFSRIAYARVMAAQRPDDARQR